MSRLMMTVEKIKQMDMVAVLAQMGFEPTRINRQDYWYLSPFRNEKDPSFKINRALNAWYDHGEGCGGNLLDFAVRWYKCSVKDVLKKFAEGNLNTDDIRYRSVLNERPETGNISIVSAQTIQHSALINYLNERRIPLNIARQYCEEVTFSMYRKQYFALGFKNDLGGYELRNAYFKGGTSPKTSTHFNNQSDVICVFEGFFNFLSYQTIFESQQGNSANFLVLNSLSFFQKHKDFLQQFRQINLYLDKDENGKKATQQALQWSTKFRDESHLYAGYKDINEWHRHIGKAPSLSRPATP